MGIKEKVDRGQQRSTSAGVAVATFKKFSEDRSSNLAAMIAFWGIFSIFPLFLVLVTVLAWVLPAADKDSVLGHVAKMLPLLDPSTISGLTGSVLAFVVGLVTALWSGTGVVRTVQFAFDSVWEIPYHQRPGLVQQTLRSVWVLSTIGAGLVLTTLISGFVVSSANGVHLGPLGTVGGYVLSAALDVGIFLAAFRILTTRVESMRDVVPGALLAGLAFFVLQQLSALIISHYLQKAQATYGHFATIITILWWFYLQAQITLLGAQLNVVLKERLYPRSLVDAPQTPADHRVLEAYAGERTYHPRQRITSRVER
ncbi:MAG TPA: YihY/virulence factor BrkB family protein [Solirubrobacteraceae bacterium]|jgi:YihY family inner membrane protein|nr:YihY/virulence factor BrkB family protein [Solirubrobacteraceae bacterium]